MSSEERVGRSGSFALPLVFFLSGAASLLFETLWFRLTGLVFGNSAWASALVLGSFMAGLAIGNIGAARIALRFEPLRAYSALELGIGITGLLLVLLLPLMPHALAPFFRTVLDSPLLHATRLLFAFVMLLIPATLMGATLPVMVGALSRSDANFGRVLGLLYGCNTIGAVVGSLSGEMFLIRELGVRGTGFVAAAGSISAGLLARAFIRRDSAARAPSASRNAAITAAPARLMLAAFASGFALLALEVLWFRFVILFVVSTSLAFAVMLAVVLAGIGFGALAASAVMNRFPDADRYAPVLSAAAAAMVVVSYAGFTANDPRYSIAAVIFDSARLMLVVSAISGAFFTILGRAIERAVGDETRAAAWMTFANTTGAALGPLVAGFGLIPSVGLERSFFVIAVVYAAITLLTLQAESPRAPILIAGAVAALALLFFPFGVFKKHFLPDATRNFRDAEIVAVREGPIETAVYLETRYGGRPYTHRLFTNGYSMSATTFESKRYMSAFVYLPLALRPQSESALLISFGVGITAKRLTEAQQLRSIDVVDISPTILEGSSIVWPGESNPLRNPRVRVHVEDGRFFLLTTSKSFDLITAEPPPPKGAGIVNLYTREHFRLIRDRLSDRGIASYWLPVYQMSDADAKSIIGAFCDAFADCSLWNGGGGEWILVGSRGLTRAPSAEEFGRQWRDPVSSAQLARLGFESPEQLAAAFLADADQLRRMTATTLPLTDDYPLRLSPDINIQMPRLLGDVRASAPRAFASSTIVRRMLPPEIVAGAPRYFGAQRLLDDVLLVPLGTPSPPPQLVRQVLTATDLRTLPRLMFGTDAWLEAIAGDARAKGDPSPGFAYVLAVGALAERDYPRAASLFDESARGFPQRAPEIAAYAALARELQRNR